MTVKNWAVIDAQQNLVNDSLVIDQANGSLDRDDVRISTRRLHGGMSEGIVQLNVEVGELQAILLPTRGMSLWKVFKNGVEFGWQSPVPGPVHPSLVPLSDPGGLGWLEGFDELLVRCGLESNGAPTFGENGRLQYGLHGRIANKPAQQVSLSVDEESGVVTIESIVDEVRLLFSKLRLATTYRMKPASPIIEITDRIVNLAAGPATAQLLYHFNVGAPVLEAGSRFVAPVESVEPRDARAKEGFANWQDYSAPEPGYAEQVYFATMQSDGEKKSTAMLKNQAENIAAAIHFRVDQLPCFSLWKNTAAVEDGYVTGMEPATNYPNPRPQEEAAGRVVQLEPLATKTFDLSLEFATQAEEVSDLEARVKKLDRS